jgi:hypothetical protein
VTVRPILTAIFKTSAIFASAGALAPASGEMVKPNCEQTIPNLLGKTLVAVGNVQASDCG